MCLFGSCRHCYQPGQNVDEKALIAQIKERLNNPIGFRNPTREIANLSQTSKKAVEKRSISDLRAYFEMDKPVAKPKPPVWNSDFIRQPNLREQSDATFCPICHRPVSKAGPHQDYENIMLFEHANQHEENCCWQKGGRYGQADNYDAAFFAAFYAP